MKCALVRAKVLGQFINAVELKFYIQITFLNLFFVAFKTHLGDLVYEEDFIGDRPIYTNESSSGL